MEARRKAARACGAAWVLALWVPAAAASAADVGAVRHSAAVATTAGEDAAVVVVPGSIGGARYVPAVDDYFHPDRFRSRAETAAADEAAGVTPGVAQRPAVLPLPTGLAMGAAGLGTLAGLRAGRRMIALGRTGVRSK